MTALLPPEPAPEPIRPPLLACEMCATVSREVELEHGQSAACGRCGTILQRYSRLSPGDWFALALTALILFIIANVMPIVEVKVQGQMRSTTLPGAIVMAWDYGHHLVAVLCGLAAIVLPGLQILLLLYVLGCLARRRITTALVPLVSLLGRVRPWSMIPVFMLAVLVALVKLADLVSVKLEPGLLGFALLTLVITMLGRLSPHELWRIAEQRRMVAIYRPGPDPLHPLAGCHACGQVQSMPSHAAHCVRCQAPLHLRKPDGLSRPWALLITAGLLYLPANLLPIMEVDSPLLGSSRHTILGGVLELGELGSWDLAAIVFIASIVVPMGKMLGLACLLLATQWRWRASLPSRTRLYRIIEFVGQWSMLDVFVVLLLAALAHFSGLMTINVGPAAASFGMVVVLTMLAAMSFDPRSAWDQARPAALGSPAIAPLPPAKP